MSWAQNSVTLAVLNLPFCIQGANRVVTLTFTPETDLPNVFLYTNSSFVGSIFSKLLTGSSYKTLGVYSLNPSCFLGSMTSGVTYSIDVKINFSAAFIGEQILPINIGFGDEVVYFEEEAWNSLTDGENSWNNDSDEILFGW